MDTHPEVHAFNVINLLVPGDPEEIMLRGRHGDWTLHRAPNYPAMREAVESKVKAVLTYTAEHADVGFSGADDLFEEIQQICLSASFLSSNTVTIRGSAPHSKTTMMNLTPDIFPREKGATGLDAALSPAGDFQRGLQSMMNRFGTNKATYHTDVIIHYWLEVMSCWSLENMFLSACTILEILKQSEARRTSNPGIHIYDAIVSLSQHLGITVLSRDWKDMRNDLVHEGRLSSTTFPGRTKADCIQVCEYVMGWIDEFMFKVHGIPPPGTKRFNRGSLEQLNSYTTA